MNPKVSICIPTFSQTRYLRTVLESVFTQTFQDFEVIVTDDSPDDSVKNLIAEYRHKSLRYHKNPVRRGSPDNWNYAVSLARGEYVKIMHHDDWFSTPNSLAEFVRLLDQNSHVDLAFSASCVCDSDQKPQFFHTPSKRELLRLSRDVTYLYSRNLVGCPSATIFRNGLDKWFDPRLKWLVDVDFYIAILRDNKLFAFRSEPLVCTTNGAPHQITAECLGDKETEVFEWVYVYHKLGDQGTPSLECFRSLWRILHKYGILSIEKILACGVPTPVPSDARVIIAFERACSKLKGLRVLRAAQSFAFWRQESSRGGKYMGRVHEHLGAHMASLARQNARLLRVLQHFWVRWVRPVLPLDRVAGTVRSYIDYLYAWRRYGRLPGAEPVRFCDSFPRLQDAVSRTPFDAHYGYQAVWAMKRIAQCNVSQHVDIGSDVGYVTMLSTHLPVVFVDIRPVNVEVETRFTCVAGSLLSLPFRDDSIQSLSCLHVAEHVGLGRYGDPLNPKGTRLVCVELARVLAPGGNLYLSVPIGKPRVCFNAHRIHSPQQILDYFQNLQVIEFSAVNDRGDLVLRADLEEMATAKYSCGLFWFRRPALCWRYAGCSPGKVVTTSR